MSEENKNKKPVKPRFDLAAVQAVSARATQKMIDKEKDAQSNVSQASKDESNLNHPLSKNPKGAGRKPVQEPAKNKVSLNLTDTELEKLNIWCSDNGMKPASAIRYCLTKFNVL